MKIVYPDYYKSFKCAAGECKDTCCTGWEIVVDSDSEEKYKSVSGGFGDKLRREMTVDEDGDTIFKPRNGRCPFLNENNLCDIHINCGEDYLCNTCNMFPRFIEDFGSVCETGLGMGCPEAVKIILSRAEKWNFISEIDSEPPEPNDIDPELYFSLITLREKLFEIIFNNNYSASCCLENILMLTGRCQECIDEECFEEIGNVCSNFTVDENAAFSPFCMKCIDILSEFEILNDKWLKIRNSLDYSTGISFTDSFRNIAAYYIYRYFMKSVFDYDAITKIRLCLFSCEVICRLHAYGLPLDDAAGIYSKEAEYSAENIEILYDLL